MSLCTLLLGLALAGAPPRETPPLVKPAAPATESAPAADAAKTTEIEAAEALLQAGDFDAAREKLAKAQKKNPRLAAPGVIIARWLLANNHTAPARAELEQVVATAPDEPEAYVLLGELAWRERRVAETELLFREALVKAGGLKGSTARRTEAEGHAHAGLATVAESRKRWATARDELTAWSKLDEKNSKPHQRLGFALFRLGKPKEAFAEYQAAAKLDPELVAEIALARLYEESGDRDNANRLMNAAVKRSPDSVAVRLAMANWQVDTGNVAEAKRQVEAALKVDPDSLDAKLLAGGIARLQHDNAAAERYLEAAHLQSPTNFAASNLLALTLADQDDPAKKLRALEFAQQNAEKLPQNSEAIATLGWALFRTSRWDEASRTLNRATATGTLNADGAYFVARMCERAGRTAEAIDLLSKALATTRPFAYQQEAEKLLAQLQGSGKEAAAASGNAPKAPK